MSRQALDTLNKNNKLVNTWFGAEIWTEIFLQQGSETMHLVCQEHLQNMGYLE